MNTSRLKQLVFLFAIFALAVSGCVRNRAQQNEDLGFFERKVGLIAYIGLDGNLYTVNQGAQDQVQWTDDAVTEDAEVNLLYQFPVWSADAQSLAFIQREFEVQSSATLHSAIYMVDTSSEENQPVLLYQSERESPSLLSWSPDGSQLAFIANTPREHSQALHLIDIETGASRIIDTGNPLLFAWSPDGELLLKHSGGSSATSSLERLAFVNYASDPATEDMLPQFPVSFGVPAWSADGQYILIASVTDDNRKAVAITDRFGNTIMTLKNFSGEVGFLFSPDGRKVAILDRFYDAEGIPRGELTIIDLEDPNTFNVLDEDNVLAFFWSPDSKKIAYFLFDQTSRASFFGLTPEEAELYLDELEAAAATATAQAEAEEPEAQPTPDTGEGAATPAPEEQGDIVSMDETIPVVNLRVYEIGSNETFLILNFLRPSNTFMRVLLQFDQFAQSGTIWSPDSENIVFSGSPTPDGLSLVLVAPANGRLLPRTIGEGVLAFWSGQ
jgi:Tol biopolymer transport system component